MSRGMNHEELAKIMKRVQDERNPFRSRMGSNGRSLPAIKYVDPCFDNRTQTWHSVTFRTMGSGTFLFHCSNEFRDVPESLFERINTWLEQETWVCAE